MISLTTLTRPMTSLMGFSFQKTALRFQSKTHRATYKRWRKTASGFKRGIQGRKHGNAGFPASVLKKRTGTAYSTHTQSKILQRLLPHL